MIRVALLFFVLLSTPLFSQSGEMMNLDSKIYVAGHRGLVGSAILRKLQAEGYTNIVTRTSKELDLTDDKAVQQFFEEENPEYVFLAAGKVGGILSNNTYPAEYLHMNFSIQDNVFEAAQKYNVKHLIFYGSSCCYPQNCEQPIKEEYFLTGPIEKTSEGYAAAKIAGIIACKAYNNQYYKKNFFSEKI